MTRPLFRRIFPSLPMSVTLLALWLLINDSVAPGHIAIGLALAWLGPIAAHRMRPLQARPKFTRGLVRLIVNIIVDVLRSNMAVARIVLGLRREAWVSDFIQIPLELTDPHALAVLAGIVTVTPGTVWAGRDPATGVLTLHVLDLRSSEAWVHFIKTRYEAPLMEIFQ